MATAKNDVTGDSIQTKASSESYRNNYDLIFRKPKTEPEQKPDEVETMKETTK